MALPIPPDSRPSATTTPRVITARTTPYSAIVCPSSLRSVSSRSMTYVWPATKSFSIRFTSFRVNWSSRALGELARDPVDGALDPAREQTERHDDAERDDGEDDAVLGHRLALLALPVVAREGEVDSSELEPVRERHLTFPPSWCRRTRGRAGRLSEPRNGDGGTGTRRSPPERESTGVPRRLFRALILLRVFGNRDMSPIPRTGGIGVAAAAFTFSNGHIPP